MIKYNGKEYRNLQEQVAKNKEDIEWLKEQPAVDGYTKAQADEKFAAKEDLEDYITKAEIEEDYAKKTTVKNIELHVINLKVMTDADGESYSYIRFTFMTNDAPPVFTGNSLGPLAEYLYNLLTYYDPYTEQDEQAFYPCSGYCWNSSTNTEITFLALKPWYNSYEEQYHLSFYGMDDDSYDYINPIDLIDDYELIDHVITLQ